MNQEKILTDLLSLPPAAQQQVLDFLAFMKSRYSKTPRTRKPKTELQANAFIGMWKGRADIQESTAWVRQLRTREWSDQ